MLESLWLLAWLVLSPASGGDAVADLRLLALSPASSAAVVEVEGEGLQVVHPGDSIGATGLEVTEVLPDRLEVELSVPAEPSQPGTPAARRRLWIYRAEGAAASRTQPLDRVAPPPPRRAVASASGDPS